MIFFEMQRFVQKLYLCYNIIIQFIVTIQIIMWAKNWEINLYEAAKTLWVNTNKTSDTSLVKPIQKNTLQKKIRRKSHNKLKDLNQ